MPSEGWRGYLLGEVATFKNGLNFGKSDVGEEIKIVGVSDFRNRSKLKGTENLASIRVSGMVKEAELLSSGDLLFVRSNGNRELIGRCLYFPEISERLAFSGFTIRARVNRSILEPEFASYLMRSSVVLDQVFLGGSGTNISNLSQAILSNIKISIPPLSEQAQIVRMLGVWDVAIATTEALLASSRSQRTALTSRLLRRHRRHDAEAHGWSKKNLSDVFERVTRKNKDGNSNVLTISGEHGLVSQLAYFNKNVASDNLSTYTLLQGGEFAYNKSYSTGYPMGAIKYLIHGKSGVVSSLYMCFRIRDDVDADVNFFRHYFEAGVLDEELMGIAQEGARNHGLLNVSVADFFGLRLFVPEVQEQRRISTVINAAESLERVIVAQIEHLRAERASLMQQLLTGRRRLRLRSGVGGVRE